MRTADCDGIEMVYRLAYAVGYRQGLRRLVGRRCWAAADALWSLTAQMADVATARKALFVGQRTGYNAGAARLWYDD